MSTADPEQIIYFTVGRTINPTGYQPLADAVREAWNGG